MADKECKNAVEAMRWLNGQIAQAARRGEVPEFISVTPTLTNNTRRGEHIAAVSFRPAEQPKPA